MLSTSLDDHLKEHARDLFITIAVTQFANKQAKGTMIVIKTIRKIYKI